MGELGIVQQTSVLFLVTDCASILQCSSDTLGKSPWKIPMEKLSIELTCPLQKMECLKTGNWSKKFSNARLKTGKG